MDRKRLYRHGLALALAIGLLAALPAALASTASEYATIRLRHSPTRVEDARLIEENLEHFQGQCVEFAGVIAGRMRCGECDLLLLKIHKGATVNIGVSNDTPQMAVGSQVRVIVRAPLSRLDLTYSLVAIAWERELAALEPRPVVMTAAVVREQPQPVRAPVPSRGARQFSHGEVVAAYAKMISRFNSRLSPGEAGAIANAIIEFSARHGLDARLVMAVVATESNFNPMATSRTGAMGLGQLMPATARGMGVGNAYDYRQNLDGAVRLIRGHLTRNSGDLGLALACYNAGSGAVRRYGGVPPYAETRNYIRKVVSLFLAFAPEYASLRR